MGKPLPMKYLEIVEAATAEIKPAFITKEYGNKFREITSNRQNFAIQQLNSAVEEAAGANRLLNIVGELPHQAFKLEPKLKAHAIEEIGHHGLFISLFDIVFPEIKVSSDLRDKIENCAPDAGNITYKAQKLSQEIVFLEIVQINIGELRNLVQLHLARPMVAAHCTNETSLKSGGLIMDQLVSDEGGHVYYTARIIEDFIDEGFSEEMRELVHEGIRLFDEDARNSMQLTENSNV